MVEKPVVLGQRAGRQLMDMMRRDHREYRNLPPPPMRQPVIRGENTFWAIIYDKVDIEMLVKESDPVFDNDGCPGPGGPRYFGSYSFFEAILSDDPEDPRPRPKPNGRFGVGGECDGAIEINRSNAAIHLEKMVVLMHVGNVADCESSEDESSSVELVGVTVHGQSTRFLYWFDLNIPREDCANRYVIASSPGNDFPSE